MAVKLNKKALDYAKKLVNSGLVVTDDRDAWSGHQPSSKAENAFIHERGFREYSRWHLGFDDAEDEETKARYKFPFGDFKNVHRCGVISAESRAGQYKHIEIENAAAELHKMINNTNSAEVASGKN